jgi:hypothetical protein
LLEVILGPTAHGTSSEAEQIFQNLQSDLELREMHAERQRRVLGSDLDDFRGGGKRAVASSDQNDVGFFIFVQVGFWRELKLIDVRYGRSSYDSWHN